MKSEPDAYGIDQLRQEGTTLWDGIRNYQARNFMRSMQAGDQAFFYHSNCKPPGIVGLMEVIETGLVDPTQFDPAAQYHDPKSKPSNRVDWRGRLLGIQSDVEPDQLRLLYSEEQLPALNGAIAYRSCRFRTPLQRTAGTPWPPPLSCLW